MERQVKRRASEVGADYMDSIALAITITITCTVGGVLFGVRHMLVGLSAAIDERFDALEKKFDNKS